MRYVGLSAFVLWCIWFLKYERRERASVSPAVWIVVTWAVIYGSRSVSEWLVGTNDGTFLAQSRDEGNPVDAFISFSLIVAGVVVLSRRSVRLSDVIRDNIWLFVFYLFWLLSVSWSDYPLITFKRVFKDLGNVVMVLVVITDRQPVDSMRVMCGRVAVLCIPLSILLIRYFPDIGRKYTGYDLSQYMWVGVTTHKNSLGVLALVGAVFLFWDLLDSRGMHRTQTEKATRASRGLVLLMCWYLLLTIDSVTALICAWLGTGLLVILRLPSVKRNPGRIEGFGLAGGAILWIVDSMINIKETLILALGRDMTLSSRTELWTIVKDYQDNPLVGAGFNTFWSGERYAALAESTSGVVQAHNGYIEIYLNGGIVGFVLLVALIVTNYWRIRKGLASGISGSAIRFVLLVLVVVYNNSEASFAKVGLLWLLTLFAVIQCRPGRITHAL